MITFRGQMITCAWRDGEATGRRQGDDRIPGWLERQTTEPHQVGPSWLERRVVKEKRYHSRRCILQGQLPGRIPLLNKRLLYLFNNTPL